MRGNPRRWAMLLPLMLSLSGCYKMTLDATALEPSVVLNARPALVGNAPLDLMEAQTRASWLFWGLLDLEEPEIEEALQRELARVGGTAVTGLEIRTQQTFMDGLLQALTLGIYSQRTTFLRGNVVRGGAGEEAAR